MAEGRGLCLHQIPWAGAASSREVGAASCLQFTAVKITWIKEGPVVIRYKRGWEKM